MPEHEPTPCKQCGGPRVRRASGKTAGMAWCRPCSSARSKRWFKENKAARQSYYQANADRWSESYQANRDAILARLRDEYAADPEAARERGRAYYERNRDRVLEKNELWRRSNRDAKAAVHGRRRARQRAAVCEHGPRCVDQHVIAALKAMPCEYCAAPMEEIDHRYPIARGGLHCRENLAPACAPCNHHKHDLLPDEWAARMSEARSHID